MWESDWITRLQALRNANLVIGSFLRGQEVKKAHAFEISRKKKVVWKFADHELARAATRVRILDDE